MIPCCCSVTKADSREHARSVDMVRLLVEHSADVNADSPNGYPLELAVVQVFDKQAMTDTVDTLLELGADLNACSSEGAGTALHAAASMVTTDSQTYIHQTKYTDKPCRCTAFRGSITPWHCYATVELTGTFEMYVVFDPCGSCICVRSMD